MEPFTQHTGWVATLNRANVDTDQIIPKQFMKLITRTGFGKHAFNDWRYLPNGDMDKNFELNQEHAQGASVLITRNNFGCGSSREHAVWAIKQYGFRTLVAPRVVQGDSTIPGFADIFRNNCLKNGVLTIELDTETVDKLFAAMSNQPRAEATIDLPAQTFTLHTKTPIQVAFDIDPATKDQLIQGLDEIALTLQSDTDITTFEKQHNVQWTAKT